MKIYRYIIVLILLFAQTIKAQVGVGTTNPNATLDIRSSNQATPNNTDGILIPKVDDFPLINPTATQDGMLVYVTGNGMSTKGFYYWDNSQTSWISATGAKRINDLIDGKSDNDGSQNGSSLFLGVDSGLNDDGTNNQNIGIGFGALLSNVNGFRNIAVGNNALNLNTSGDRNTAFGYLTLNSNVDGGGNTAIGYRVLEDNTSGTANSGLGFHALQNNTSGYGNTALGHGSLRNSNTGFYNSALGRYAGSSVRGNFNTLLGAYSGPPTTVQSIDGSVMIGYASGNNELNSNRLYIENSDANANNALIYGEFDNDILRTNSQFQIGNPTLTGYAFPTVDGAVNQVLQTNGSGNLNWVDPNLTVIHSINDLTDGKSDADGSSVFFGIGSGANDDGSSNGNVGVGYLSLSLNISGSSNTASGSRALSSNASGDFNTASGSRALFSNTTGNFNTANGSRALMSNTYGFSNTAIGNGTLSDNTSGAGNTASGELALSSNTSGDLNIANGISALNSNTIGSNNIGVGIASGYNNSNGNYNIFLGNNAGFNETGSHKLYIESNITNSDDALIYGEFDNNILGFNANVGVGTQTPGSRLHVVEEGIAGVQTIVASVASNTSNRPVLLFSETGSIGLNEGMSLEYNGVGLAGENRMIFNGLGGNPLIEFRNDGNLIALSGRIGVQTTAPTCAVEINHPIGIANEGLKLTNQVDTDAWRFYVQWNTNLLSLLYNNVNVGNFDNVSGVYTAISDRNLKTNISNLPSVLEKIQTLQVVDYNFKFQNGSKKYVGLIAQDVESIFPHLVSPPNEESENYTMDYSGFGVLAIKAIQEQQEEISNLKSQLKEQQNEIAEIKNILKTLLERK